MIQNVNKRFLKIIYPVFLLILCFILLYPQNSPAQFMPFFGAPFGGFGAPYSGSGDPFRG